MVLPVALLPEAEALGGGIAPRPLRAEGRVAVDLALEVHVPQLAHIGPDDLVGVDVDDPVEPGGEEHVEEEDLVGPDEPLLLRLGVQPARPLVGHKLVIEGIPGGHVGDEFPELGAEEVVDEPEVQRTAGVLPHRLDHDPQQPLVQVARRKGEYVHRRTGGAHVSCLVLPFEQPREALPEPWLVLLPAGAALFLVPALGRIGVTRLLQLDDVRLSEERRDLHRSWWRVVVGGWVGVRNLHHKDAGIGLELEVTQIAHHLSVVQRGRLLLLLLLVGGRPVL
mmetsp:Transcript_27378/g.78779  ORF Transcript_27378/g.78779 Transcript_27378/m.78779 type:complete len:280 (-) Transcript_27378:419-1258(-)